MVALVVRMARREGIAVSPLQNEALHVCLDGNCQPVDSSEKECLTVRAGNGNGKGGADGAGENKNGQGNTCGGGKASAG